MNVTSHSLTHLDALVLSGKLDQASKSVLLLNQSHGWLVAAESITVGAANHPVNGTVYHALPALFALYHGIELFLKGVTCELTGKPPTKTHNLAELHEKYTRAINSKDHCDLIIKADIQRFIDWDNQLQKAQRKSPHGSDFRYILDHHGKTYWPGITIMYRHLVDWSREYRRDFSRIRRSLLKVNGFGMFWEEGTFSRHYPNQALWFFCLCGRTESNGAPNSWEHKLVDSRGRQWTAYEGESINEENFVITSVGRVPEPYVRLETSLDQLPYRLGEVP